MKVIPNETIYASRIEKGQSPAHSFLCQTLFMDMHERLKIARRDAGYTKKSDAARALGVSYPTYAGHENGTRAYDWETAKKYAKKFNVSAEWLLDGRPEAPKTSSDVLGISPENAIDTSVFKVVPEYNVHVSAGGGAAVGDEEVVAQWPFNPEYLNKFLGLTRAQLALVEVRGDSMEPTLNPGDRVLVNMSDKQISQSGIFVLFDGDGTVVKRVDKRIGDDETVTLISDNTIHERYDVPLDQVNVVGRVVWVARRL